MDDPRFKHLASDPRFKAIPKKSRKVTIDSRFQSMFTDDKFKVKYKVDKRGRKVKQTSSEDLRKYYELEDGGIAEKEGKKEKKGKASGGECQSVVTSGRKKGRATDSLNSGDTSEGGSETDSEVGSESEASSTDLGEEGEEDEEDAPAHYIGGIGELTEEAVSAPLSDATSCRLAVVNMDWDHVGARDIFVLLNSFKPAGASIFSVNVYPSDFGLERMAKEDVEGPVPLSPRSEGVSHDRGKDQSGEGEEYSKEKLRKYQLSRFKYYYAVVECDSEGTAEHIYTQCNGLEYEHSGGQLDLRFIPDEMTFDDREPASTATEGSATADFTPVDFVSSALQQSKVKLTWDETDPHRVKVTQRKFTKDDLQSMDFSAYLASSSSEGEESAGEGEGEEEGSHARKALKYKELLQGGGEGEESGDSAGEEMEITWEPGLKETTEKIVKNKKKKAEGQSPWEQYLQQKKEKRKAAKQQKRQQRGKEEGPGSGSEATAAGFDDPFFTHSVTTATAGTTRKKGKKRSLDEEQLKEKEALELLMLSDGEAEEKAGSTKKMKKEHFSFSSILRAEKEAGKKKKRKRKNEEVGMADEFKVDVTDPRFKAIYESHLFAPDPSAPQYRDTKGMAEIMKERRRRGLPKHHQQDPTTGQTLSTTDTSLTSLINSVKAKTKSFKEKKRKVKSAT